MDPCLWSAPPHPLSVEKGWVHVFRLRLDLPEARLAALRGLLDEEEQARAIRYRNPRDGTRFTASHGQLREILSGYTKIAPHLLRFAPNAYGKPDLVWDGGLSFNLSHSADVGLVSVTAGQAVGIDIEVVRSDLAYENVARRFFASAEVEALMALQVEQREAAFFACWTRKEAYIKGRGLGLSIPLSGFVVSLAPGDPPRLLEAADLPQGEEWTLLEVDPGLRLAAALAVNGPVEGIRCWNWL